MNKAYFVNGLRTPFGRAHKGAYKDHRPDDLLVNLFLAQKEKNSELWNRVPDDVLVGCAYPEGEQGYNIARMASLGSGLEVTGVTVNRLCASSLEVVAIAAARIRTGWGEKYLLGGIESMSRVKRLGEDFSASELIEKHSPHAYITMGLTAEQVSRRYLAITREVQEEFAARSHEFTHNAYEEGFYEKQIHPHLIARDEFVRFPVNWEKIRSLPPAFVEDGVVTAATSSPLTDGATSGWLVSEKTALELGVGSGLEVIDIAWGHVAPEVMGLGPVPATRKIFSNNNLSADDISAYEINEAFAVQVLASIADLELPKDRVNTWGGAMATGHPLGASGLRLVMTLHDRMAIEDSDGALGIATLCVGGGQGMAVLFKYRKF